MPALGFGTWELEGDVCVDAVSRALDVGYRHVDTAVRYGNEAQVGRALRASGIARDELFVTTKVWHDALRHDDVLASLERSLDRLGLDYVDLFLVHWPNPAVPLAETLAAMGEARASGRARHIGVSNFTIAHLKEGCDVLDATLDAHQFELHPYLDQTALIAATRQRGMIVEAYQPLAGGLVIRDAEIAEIARRYNRSAAQIALRWLMDQPDVVAIPRSRNAANIASNLAIFDFELDAADIQRIDGLRGNRRFVNPAFAPQWD
ncbi:aldo/keto reductase [Paraburkholderia tropica]|uniref:aldo/keto reductase n=1 Tax=Paraburkholderia tropica TaxID=92647 RepID=UPI002AB74BAB|nr:aldo/keto reductase [Paraburkholderia tropica]